MCVIDVFFFFQAEDGIRDAQESRGLGDVYKRQVLPQPEEAETAASTSAGVTAQHPSARRASAAPRACLLYTSDAADDPLCVDLGGRRIIKKNKTNAE